MIPRALRAALTVLRIQALVPPTIDHCSQAPNNILHCLRLSTQLLGSCRTLLGVGRTALGNLLHLRNCPANLVDAPRLKQADLTKLSKQIDITVTGEGLKIELIEDKGGTFFEKGSPKLSENGVSLINLLSAQLKVLPNRLLIEGHTDAQAYSGATGYTNWELSSDRANSARRLLQLDGVGPNQISQVRGYADQMLRVPANPLDPSNRRISLIVQWVDAAPPPSEPHKPLPTSYPRADTAQGRTAKSSTNSVGSTITPEMMFDRPQSSQTTPATLSKEKATTPALVPRPNWISRIKSVLPKKK